MTASDPGPTDVIVVGGGLAGLTAAARLTRAGRSVVVCEAASAIGGRARSRHIDGFALNLGPHALFRGGPGWPILHDLGITPRGGTPKLHTTLVRIDGEVRPVLAVLRGKVRGRVRLARFVAGYGPAAEPGESAATWIERVVDDPVARRVAWATVRTATYQADLHQLPAADARGQLRAVGRGVCYLHGGWQSLVGQLATRVRSSGGQIRESCAVRAIERDGHCFAVRLADDRVLRARSVVVTLNSPDQVARLLPEPQAALARAASCGPSVRMAHLDVALRPAGSPGGNVLSLDDDIFVTVPSAVAEVAPPDGMVVSLGRYLRAGEQDTDHRGELEAVLDTLRPGWRDDAVDARYTPRSLVTASGRTMALDGAPRLAVDALDHGGTGGGAGGVPGLLVAGDWVGPQGLLADAAIASGAACADALLSPTVQGRGRGARHGAGHGDGHGGPRRSGAGSVAADARMSR